MCIFITICFALSIASFEIDQFQINITYFDDNYPRIFEHFRGQALTSKDIFFKHVKYLNYLLNNFVSLLIEFFLDILLIKGMQINLKKHSELTKNQDNELVQLKTNLMVFISCSLILIFRVGEVYFFVMYQINNNPELLWNRNYKYLNDNESEFACFYLYDYDVCTIYITIADFFFIVSNSFNVMLIFVFNSKFKKNLLEFISEKLKYKL